MKPPDAPTSGTPKAASHSPSPPVESPAASQRSAGERELAAEAPSLRRRLPWWHLRARIGSAREGRAARLVMELVRQNQDRDSEPIERRLLDLVLRETAATGGAVLRYRAGRFVVEAQAGTAPPSMRELCQQGVPYGDTLIWRARRQGRPIYLGRSSKEPASRQRLAELGLGALAIVPVAGDRVGEELVIALFHDRPHDWPHRTRVLLDGAASVLLGAIIQRDTEHRLSEMVRLQRELLATPVDSMYQRALETAMRVVRTAEAGSLLVRGADGTFRYVAAAGFDLAGLADLRLGVDAMKVWYGDGEHWTAGVPRVLVTTGDQSVSDVSALTAPRDRMRNAGRVDEIAADLCLPIAYRGDVLAVLNLDSLHDPHAFGATATRATSDLAPVVGFLLHETAARARLDLVARTDELTGLGNRRMFNEQAARELALAARHGEELTLLVMDLAHFKDLNDAFGHVAGDEALRRVAKAVLASVREADTTFRWGGDEFAALLPRSGLRTAEAVARRIEDRLSHIHSVGAPLHINAGAASAPADGINLDALLTRADHRMYRAKAEARVWASDAAV